MCPPLIVAAVVAVGVGVAAGVTAKAIGDANARGDFAEAMRLRKEAAAKYGSIILPKIDTILTQTIGPTELAKLQDGGAGKDAQLSALEKYKGLLAGGGNDAQTRLNNMQAQNEAGRINSGMQGQVSQEMAQRGMSGSGYEWAGRDSAAQAGANRAALMQAQGAADASGRYMSALGGYAGLGSNIREQDYGQQRDRAMAQDAINKWNAQNQQDVQKYNNTVSQGNFQNQLDLTNAQNNAMMGLANATAGEGQRKQADANAYGQVVQQGANTIGGALAKGA